MKYDCIKFIDSVSIHENVQRNVLLFNLNFNISKIKITEILVC